MSYALDSIQMFTEFCWENGNERDNLNLTDIGSIWEKGDVEWNSFDSNECRTVLTMVMIIRFPEITANCLIS
jgi:hypothetical protein